MSEVKAYVGRKACGCITAAIIDDGRMDRKQMAKIVGVMIEGNLAIDRVGVEDLGESLGPCHCNEKKKSPLFDFAGVKVEDDKPETKDVTPAEELKAEAPAGDVLPSPSAGVETVNAAGEKCVLIPETGELLPVDIAAAIEAAEPQPQPSVPESEPIAEDLHDQVREALVETCATINATCPDVHAEVVPGS